MLDRELSTSMSMRPAMYIFLNENVQCCIFPLMAFFAPITVDQQLKSSIKETPIIVNGNAASDNSPAC